MNIHKIPQKLQLMSETIKLGARIIDNFYNTAVDTTTEKGKIIFVYLLCKLLIKVCADEDVRLKVNSIVTELEKLNKR